MVWMHYSAVQRRAQARGSPAAVVRDASEPVPALDAGRGRRDRPADHEGAAVRRPGRRGGAEEQFLRPVGGRRACRCGAEVALFASLGEGGGGHLRARPHLLRGREHLHARLLVAPLQGQLLQVHQRDAALPRGGQRAERHPLPGRLQRRHRRRRLRAGARVRRDPAGRRRLLDGLAAGGAAPRRASGHRRPHASGGQAQGAARPGRRLLHPGGGDQREAGGRVGPGRRGGAAQQVRRGDPAAREGAGGRRAGGRVATLTVRAPEGEVPKDAAGALARGAAGWGIRAARELDDALLRLRFHHEGIGLVLLRTEGDRAKAHAVGELLGGPQRNEWILRETRLLWQRVLRRLDVTARSLFAVLDAKSCFAGPLFELLVAADRSYVLDADGVEVRPGALSEGALPGWNGLSRLEMRFLASPARAKAVIAAGREGPIDAARAHKLGLATVLADDIDFEEELRVAVVERASLSPDALTGMEASYRFPGPETLATKIFGRLSAWQNWIFIRPNATGETGALTLYGKPERPRFDFRRT